jgi:predicted nucleic acid-binding Zn ribbon protein
VKKRRGKSKPVTIGDAIQSLLASGSIGAGIEQARVVGEWADIVGKQIAAVTRARAVTRDGTLQVLVKSNAWMSELSLREPEILSAIHARLPTSRVSRIVWMLRR